jgi:predicted nucleic acid-binding protein
MTDRAATTPVVVMEILKSRKEYDNLSKDLAALRSFDLSPKVWERACKLGHTLRHKGINAPLTDTLIAALAQEYNAILLHDGRHYEMIGSVIHLRHELLKPG